MPRSRNDDKSLTFEGFSKPESNFFKMPNYWTDITAHIKTIAELKVIEYVLRHTWGFQEFGIKKHITVEEFVNGRRRQDGSRLDLGTGLSERSVQYGLKDAVAHGYLDEEVDDSDRGRVKKYYSLRMRLENDLESDGHQERNPASTLGVQSLHPRVQDLRGRGAKAAPRTEKDTRERNFEDRNPILSNNFESQAQNFNGSSIFLNSKNENEILKSGDLEEETPAEKAEEERRRGDYQPQTPSRNGPKTVGEILKGRGVKTSRKTPPRSSKTASTAALEARAVLRQGRGRNGLPEPPRWLKAHIRRLSIELHDASEEQVARNIGQAHNLYLYTGAEEGRFEDRLNEAKRITLSYDIEKRAAGEEGKWGARNKMPYYFKVLRELLGLKDIPASQTKPEAARRKGRGHNVNEQLYSS